MDERHTRKIFFDSEYRDQVEKMSAHVAKLVDVALSQLLHEFTKYFIAGNVQKTDSFVSRMSVRLGRLHEIIPRRLGLSFPIEFGIGFVNGLGKVRSRLGI